MAELSTAADVAWVPLQPRFSASRRTAAAWIKIASRFDAAMSCQEMARRLCDVETEIAHAEPRDAAPLRAAALLIGDLHRQGWQLRLRNARLEGLPPSVSDDREGEKARVRAQELVKRDEQLLSPSVRKFVEDMERSRIHGHRLTSIFTLFRDGRELSKQLEGVRAVADTEERADRLRSVIDPYLQFVDDSTTCEHSGLRLMDVWRYFRHTWSNQYTSTPGRTMMFLVRDRAAPDHPVVGIGSLGSPIVQISIRDRRIGWLPDQFVATMEAEPTDELAAWLVRMVDESIEQIYTDDLVESGHLSRASLRTPSESVIEALVELGRDERRKHHRFAAAKEFKGRMGDTEQDVPRWVARARTHLFRSKRALTLAESLRARAALGACFGKRPSAAGLRRLLADPHGRRVARRIVRKAKGDRVGIAMADITVCGAVPPYNALLGGKLTCMLSASPEVVEAYARRYAEAESEIASSMAGRPIVRSPNLVYLGTTSLYGVGSSQYNRVRIPGAVLGSPKGGGIRFRELGRSDSFGTSQYSSRTLDALVQLTMQSEGGVRVNSIFGEGVSPKLRKIRDGLTVLGFPADALLRHGRARIVYGVPLVRNALRYLLGIDAEPDYVFSTRGPDASARIAAWWRERWLARRIESDNVLADVRRHSLVRPIRHGARVPLPPQEDDDPPLFPDVR